MQKFLYKNSYNKIKTYDTASLIRKIYSLVKQTDAFKIKEADILKYKEYNGKEVFTKATLKKLYLFFKQPERYNIKRHSRYVYIEPIDRKQINDKPDEYDIRHLLINVNESNIYKLTSLTGYSDVVIRALKTGRWKATEKMVLTIKKYINEI